jgi:HK97 family phage prohead protease
MKNSSELPRFFANAELRVIDGANGRPRIVGYAAVFNARSGNLGGFREEIAPGAFTDALAANEEVLALVEHSPEKILGRRSMGTLTLAQDDKGLRVEIDPPNTTVGNDAVENVRRGDIKGMSFRFPRGAKDSWRSDGGDSVRTLHKVGLLEVTLTSVPAYDATSVSLRALNDKEEGEMRAYYESEIAKLKPPTAPPTTPKRNMAERRLKLLAGEQRCGCDSPVMVVSEPDPADSVRYALYAARQSVDAASDAMDALSDLGDDVDANLIRTCTDAANQADLAVKRLKELATACRAVKMPAAPATDAATAE